MARSALLMSALLLPGCERKDAGPTPRPAPARPELKVNLRQELGREVEVTGLLAGVSTDATEEREGWVGETTVVLECQGAKLTCRFHRVKKVPVPLVPGVPGSDVRLLTVRGTVASVEPDGTATLTDCVVVGDPAKP